MSDFSAPGPNHPASRRLRAVESRRRDDDDDDGGQIYPSAAELLDAPQVSPPKEAPPPPPVPHSAPQDALALNAPPPPLPWTALRGQQVGGTHYDDMAISPLEYIEANGLDFATGSVIKYVSRHEVKGGLQDLLKARHYVEVLIERYKDKG